LRVVVLQDLKVAALPEPLTVLGLTNIALSAVQPGKLFTVVNSTRVGTRGDGFVLYYWCVL
jgi:hypothetical protein